MRPVVTYTPCAKSLKEQTGNGITFAQFEEGNILTKTSGDESNDKSITTMDYGDKSYHDLVSKDTLEDIRDRSQTHLNVNRREARC